MKRLYEFINAWVPAIAINAHCNNDVKLLTNSRETINVSFYITAYLMKKQGCSYNLSAIMMKTFTYHDKQATYAEDIHDQQWKLIFHLVHAVNREQELSAPMVISYLMGWKDCYHSHWYAPIYWTSFVTAMFEAFLELCRWQCSKTVECRSENLDEKEIPVTYASWNTTSDIDERSSGVAEQSEERATDITGEDGEVGESIRMSKVLAEGTEIRHALRWSLWM